MRRISLLLLIAALLACSHNAYSDSVDPEDYPSQAGDVISEAKASIHKVSEQWFGIVPDFNPATRFAPDDLPESFRKDGLRIVFSGVIGEIPANQRMWGTPLELTDIRLLEE